MKNKINLILKLSLLLASNLLNCMSSDIDSELVSAIQKQDCEKIQKLVKKNKTDLNKLISSNGVLLEIPLRSGLSRSFKTLLDLGADPFYGNVFFEAKQACGWTADQQEGDDHDIDLGRREIIEILEKYLDRNKKDKIKKVLSSINIPDVIIDLIDEYSKEGKNNELFYIDQKQRKILEEAQKQKNIKLNSAIDKNNIELVKKLIQEGAQVNEYVNGYGMPLSCCLRNGSSDIFEFLLEQGADPYLETGPESTVFDDAQEARWYWGTPAENREKIYAGRDKIIEILKKYHKKTQPKPAPVYELNIIDDHFV